MWAISLNPLHLEKLSLLIVLFFPFLDLCTNPSKGVIGNIEVIVLVSISVPFGKTGGISGRLRQRYTYFGYIIELDAPNKVC